MNTYILVLVTMLGGYPDARMIHKEMGMAECFEKRDTLVERLGRPIVGYQVVCMRGKEDEL